MVIEFSQKDSKNNSNHHSRGVVPHALYVDHYKDLNGNNFRLHHCSSPKCFIFLTTVVKELF